MSIKYLILWHYNAKIFFMNKKSNPNIKSFNFRIPIELHKVLRSASYYSAKSINRIILELICDGFGEWKKYNLYEISAGDSGDYLIDSERQEIIDSMESVIKELEDEFHGEDLNKYGNE